MSLADGETRKFWAGNNTPGKKGFQPKGDRVVDNNAGRVHPEMPPTTSELAAHEASTRTPIADSDRVTIRRQVLTDDERQAAGLPTTDVNDYQRVMHPDGKTLVGYVRGNWEYEMVPGQRYRSGRLSRQGYDTFAPDGTKLGYGSNASGAKWSLSRDWNKSIAATSSVKSVAIPGAPKQGTITAGRYTRRSGQVLGDATSRGRSSSGGGYRIVALPTGRGTKVVLVPAADVKEL